MKKKKIFIICPVRKATKKIKRQLEEYTRILEEEGNCEVHLPHRDTNQNGTGIEISTQNTNAIKNADEVHIFYMPNSTGIHFDLGVTFAYKKKLVVVSNDTSPRGMSKSYSTFLEIYEEYSKTF